MNIQLYINKEEIELTDGVSFPITKTFDDINNPTTIINDFSKTIQIPFTARNNKLFGEFFRADKAITVGTEDQLMGVYFDPTKKNDFVLLYNGQLVMAGYCKVNDVVKVNGNGHYNITLCGTLGKVFQEYQKITFDKSATDDRYLIDGASYVNDYINAELVAKSWGGTKVLNSLQMLFLPSGKIGFAYDNSYTDSFDYKTTQVSETATKQLSDILEESNFEARTGISAESAIGDGILPRNYSQCRSYLNTIPYIHISDLFEVFTDKADELTDYLIELDSEWFNSDNPYWKDLVFTLKKFDVNDGDIIKRTVSCNDPFATDNYVRTQQAANEFYYTPDIATYESNSSFYGTTEDEEGIVDVANHRFNMTAHRDICFNTNLQAKLNVGRYFPTITDIDYETRIAKDVAFVVEYDFFDEQGNLFDTTKVALVCNDTSIDKASYDYVSVVDNWKHHAHQDMEYRYVMIPLHKYFTYVETGDYFTVSVHTHWDGMTSESGINPTPRPFEGKINGEWQGIYPTSVSIEFTPKLDIQHSDKVRRSDSLFDLNDIWDNDYNLFDEILNYCKQMHILIYVDEARRKVVFTPYTSYFADNTIEDWTDKLDLTNDYQILAPAFDCKYILFNYKDDTTGIGKRYKASYGVNFGEHKVITQYNFNADTKKLYTDIAQCPITNTDNVLSWKSLLTDGSYTYTVYTEKYVYAKDDKEKSVSKFGCYYFYNNLQGINTAIIITDDTKFQKGNNLFCYSDIATSENPYYYSMRIPYLDIIKGDNCCTFGIPSVCYTYNSSYEGKKSIYENFWKDYIEERYNIQNKIVTCYLKLTPMDFINFNFNKFVYIGDRLYMVNKIYDYDITSNGTTKVDLITISDITAYTGE